MFMEGLRAAAQAAPAGGGGLVEALVQATVRDRGGGLDRPRRRGTGLQGEGHELVDDVLAGTKGGHSGHGGEGQGHPTTAGALAVAQFHPIVPVAQGNRQIPLGGMTVDHNLLEGVGVGGAGRHPGHIRHPQTELTGACGQGGLPIAVGDFPEHVGPLRIPGQKHQAGFRCWPGSGSHLRFDGLQVSGRQSWLGELGLAETRGLIGNGLG